MTKAFLGVLAAASLLTGPAFAATSYTLDPAHTTVIWQANHFQFSNPHGLMSMIDGTVTLDEANPSASTVEATWNGNNLVTGNPKFDEHLKSKDFLSIGEFPTATFKSTKVEPSADNKTAKVTGNMTIRGITQPLVLDVTFNHKGEHFMTKKPTVGFTATGVIKRSLYGMDIAIPGVSDDVKIVIEAEANGA